MSVVVQDFLLQHTSAADARRTDPPELEPLRARHTFLPAMRADLIFMRAALALIAERLQSARAQVVPVYTRVGV